MAAKQQLLDLVDHLPDEQLQTLYRVALALAADPVLFSLLTAPPDDETYTAEQQQRDLEAFQRHRRGESIPHDQVLEEFGV